MTHDQAIALMTTERYLLGELLDSQIDEFEEHFFACPSCAEDVKACHSFILRLREMRREEKKHAEADKCQS